MTDKLMRSHKTTFTRYADDYHIFVESVDDAYGKLLFLSEKLLRNEGLALQKSKTRIMTGSEFLSTQSLIIQPEAEDVNSDVRHLFSLNLRYDPYSTTADDDYRRLKRELVLRVLDSEGVL
jgi:hypothetical protein